MNTKKLYTKRKTIIKMKSFISLQILIIITMGLFPNTSSAQNYNFTLIDNNNFSYTIAAESLFDSGGFQPITQSYGFVIVVPDGTTLNVDQVLPAGTANTVTPIAGSSLAPFDATMADKDLFLITTNTAGGTIDAHANGATIPLFTITITPPVSGNITLLDNNSTLANAPALGGALDAFFQVDIINDSTVNFTNQFNMLGTASSIAFTVLSTEEVIQPITDLTLYPNPAKDYVEIRTTNLTVDKVEIFDLSGKLVSEVKNPSSQITVSSLESAMYIMIIHTDKGKNIKKLVKE
ncbi:MAG: T9SS type A sorting domain-containing protein [Bacteroidota bacterium]